MAGIKLNDLILDGVGWPGPIQSQMGIPTNGWDGTKDAGNCVTEPLHRIGQKLMAYNDGSRNPGWYTMQYLRFFEGTDLAQDIGAVSEGYRVCCHAETSAAGDVTVGDYTYAPWYVVTNDCTNSDATRGGPPAIPAADLSHNQYGWFWIEGVCPVKDVTKFVVSGDVTGRLLKSTGDVSNGWKVALAGDGTNGIGLDTAADITLYTDSSFAIGSVIGASIGWVTNQDA